MKKLMIALAAAAMAVGVQAAQADWNMTINGASTAGLGANAYVAYMLDASMWNTYVEGSVMNADYLTKALSDATGDKSVAFTADGTKLITGNQSFTTEAASVAYKMILVDAAKTKWAIVKEDTVETYDPERGSGTSQNGSTTAQRVLGTAQSGNLVWGTVESGSVPEPTSAMLLLLGVAGLALRRRRA